MITTLMIVLNTKKGRDLKAPRIA